MSPTLPADRTFTYGQMSVGDMTVLYADAEDGRWIATAAITGVLGKRAPDVRGRLDAHPATATITMPRPGISGTRLYARSDAIGMYLSDLTVAPEHTEALDRLRTHFAHQHPCVAYEGDLPEDVIVGGVALRCHRYAGRWWVCAEDLAESIGSDVIDSHTVSARYMPSTGQHFGRFFPREELIAAVPSFILTELDQQFGIDPVAVAPADPSHEVTIGTWCEVAAALASLAQAGTTVDTTAAADIAAEKINRWAAEHARG